jgi:hypothetical protein
LRIGVQVGTGADCRFPQDAHQGTDFIQGTALRWDIPHSILGNGKKAQGYDYADDRQNSPHEFSSFLTMFDL